MLLWKILGLKYEKEATKIVSLRHMHCNHILKGKLNSKYLKIGVFEVEV